MNYSLHSLAIRDLPEHCRRSLAFFGFEFAWRIKFSNDLTRLKNYKYILIIAKTRSSRWVEVGRYVSLSLSSKTKRKLQPKPKDKKNSLIRPCHPEERKVDNCGRQLEISCAASPLWRPCSARRNMGGGGRRSGTDNAALAMADDASKIRRHTTHKGGRNHVKVTIRRGRAGDLRATCCF